MSKITIKGTIDGKRVPSRILEEQIQQAVLDGARELQIIAEGQHGIGGRIWPKGETVKITVEGPVGLADSGEPLSARLACLSRPGTR